MTAFEAHLASTAVQTTRLIGHRRQLVRAALADIGLRLSTHRELGAIAQADLRLAIHVLDQALARERVASVHQLERQVRIIANAGSDLDGEIAAALASMGRRIETATLRALRRYQLARDALDVEMRVAAASRRLMLGYRGRALAERRRELAAEVARLKGLLEERRASLEEQRRRSARSWRKVDAGLRSSVEEVSAALQRLLS